MGPIWGRQDPGGSHVGPMNFAMRDSTANFCTYDSYHTNYKLLLQNIGRKFNNGKTLCQLDLDFSLKSYKWKIACEMSVWCGWPQGLVQIMLIISLGLVVACQLNFVCRAEEIEFVNMFYYTPRTTKLLGGILVSVRPSVRLSVRPSVCPACRVRSVTSTVLDGFFPY